MKNGKFESRAEVADAMEREGDEYFVSTLALVGQMPDRETARAFSSAEDAYEVFYDRIEKLRRLVGLE